MIECTYGDDGEGEALSRDLLDGREGGREAVGGRVSRAGRVGGGRVGRGGGHGDSVVVRLGHVARLDASDLLDLGDQGSVLGNL